MKYVLLLGAGAVLVLGLAGFYLFGASSADREPDAVTATESVATTSVITSTIPMTGKATVTRLLESEQSLECEITYNVLNEGEVTGTMFVADGEVRTDFLLTSPEFGQYASSIIMLEDFVYSWSQIEGSSYGVKVATARLQNPEEANSSVPLTLNDEVGYSCNPWENVDRSVFIPPTTIIFKDAVGIDAEYGTVYEEGELY